jgi:hypothetical protein
LKILNVTANFYKSFVVTKLSFILKSKGKFFYESTTPKSEPPLTLFFLSLFTHTSRLVGFGDEAISFT